MKNAALQGLRGLAILYVILFHLNPKLFPYGFVGVDMFFVLSGYLMTKILGRQRINFEVIKNFYQRRFSRIVPLYYSFVLLTYCGCGLILLSSDKIQLMTDLKWSLFFGSNMQPMFEEKGYWDQLAQFRFLAHSWSLGVEIQFYLIVPILFYFLNRPGTSISKRASILVVLTIVSLIFQIFSPTKVSYGFLFSRIWQFLSGALCFTLQTFEESDFSKSKQDLCDFISDSSTFILTMIIIWTPSLGIHSEMIMRIIGTFCAVLVIYFSEKGNSSTLSERWLVSLGDVSYVCYLLHWPLIVSVRYLSPNNVLQGFTPFLLFIVIITLSYAAHHTLENLLVKSDVSVGITFSLICLLTIAFSMSYYNSFSISFSPTEEKQSSENTTIPDAIKWNLLETKKIYFKIPCTKDITTPEWTNFSNESQLRCETEGNGTAKILVLGNSIAYRAFPLIHEILAGRYKSLRLFSVSGCVPLTNMCPDFTNAAKIVVNMTKPDIIFHIHVSTEDLLLRPILDLNKDFTFVEMQKNIDFYSSIASHIVIDVPYYVAEGVRVAYEIVRRLKFGIPLDTLKINKTTDIDQQQYHRKRILGLRCKNCEFNPVNEALFNGSDEYYFYNRSSLRAFTNDGGHLTPEGLNLIRPYYTKIIERLLKNF